jgi:Spy/CpxP family protein refolding chaperone
MNVRIRGKVFPVVIAVIVIAFTVGIANAYDNKGDDAAGDPRGGGFASRGEMMEELMQGLNLTPDQQAQIKTFHDAQAEQRQAAGVQMREKHKALRAELEKYDHDPAKVNALVDEIALEQKARMQDRVASIVAIKQILTEEQFNAMQVKMKEKHEARKALWQERMRQRRGADISEGPEPEPEI